MSKPNKQAAPSATASKAGKAPLKTRYEPGPGKPLWQKALLVLAICHVFLIPLSLFALAEATGPTETFKLILVGVGAAAAAYVVNRFSIEKLAPLHARNFQLAGVFAVLIIVATGSGMFLGSLNALVSSPVEARVYQENGEDLQSYIGAVHEATLVAERIAPDVLAVAEDIQRTRDCEVDVACLSRGVAGRGSMSIALEAVAAQAFGVAQALERGSVDRMQHLDDLNRLYRDYTTQLADAGTSLSERRVALQSIHAEVRQIASALSEALPMTRVDGLVRDLRAGTSVAGDPTGTITLNSYLRAHGTALDEALDRMPEVELEAPTFPARPGMLDTLRFLPEFAAIAGIVFVAELCLPITLYVMTWLRLYWQLYRGEEEVERGPQDDGFEDLLDRQAGEDDV